MPDVRASSRDLQNGYRPSMWTCNITRPREKLLCFFDRYRQKMFAQTGQNFRESFSSNRTDQLFHGETMNSITSCVLVALLLASIAHGQATSSAANAGTSNFSLTIYSTADPATFHPEQLAQHLP